MVSTQETCATDWMVWLNWRNVCTSFIAHLDERRIKTILLLQTSGPGLSQFTFLSRWTSDNAKGDKSMIRIQFRSLQVSRKHVVAFLSSESNTPHIQRVTLFWNITDISAKLKATGRWHHLWWRIEAGSGTVWARKSKNETEALKS